MKIKRCPIMFQNVLSANAKCSGGDWFRLAQGLRNTIIQNGLYNTGPFIYQIHSFDEEQHEGEFTFHQPINEVVEMETNEKFSFDKVLTFEDGLLLRHADLDDDIEESYTILRACAEEMNFKLQEPFYNIYLNVYGDGIIDIYAPIIEEGQSD